MIADAIATILSNIPVVMFILAIVVATIVKTPADRAERYFAWLLLFSVGVEALWGGLFHVFFPELASAQIGWQPSPYEYEIGVADIALGLIAIASFWRSLEFKSAVAVYAVLFDAGVAIGHIRLALTNDDYSPDNVGPMLVVTLLHVILLPWLLWVIWQKRRHGAAA